jgi:hypothetical protein
MTASPAPCSKVIMFALPGTLPCSVKPCDLVLAKHVAEESPGRNLASASSRGCRGSVFEAHAGQCLEMVEIACFTRAAKIVLACVHQKTILQNGCRHPFKMLR